jgi:hypothetical protein
MSFELHDLSGKPKEQGTIEEWWASPSKHRVVIESPSLNTVDSSESTSPYNRENYLVHELLNQVVHPIPRYGNFQNLGVRRSKRQFGQVELSCLTVFVADSKQEKNTFPVGNQFCVQPGSNSLRVEFYPGELSIIRNELGTFSNTEVSRSTTIAYGQNVAITGHVNLLENYHSDESQEMELTPDDPGSLIPGIVIAGHQRRFMSPALPDAVSLGHLNESVVLCIVITKIGEVKSLDVVESPNKIVSEIVTNAVKQWTYTPFLLNGSPIEVRTIVTVDYRSSH